MEFNFKSYEQIAAKVANRALDEFEFNGKTIREWAEALTYPKTNADRIRAMSDEALAGWLSIYCRGKTPPYEPCRKSCEACWLDWLRQEAEP